MVAPSHWSNKKNKDEMPSAGETPSTEKTSDRGKFPAAYPERPLTAKQLLSLAELKKLVLECVLMYKPNEPDARKRLRDVTGPPKQKRVYGGGCGKRNPLVYVLEHDEKEEEENERATEPPNVEHGENEFYFQADGACVVRMLHDSGCTYHAVDEMSKLVALMYDRKPCKGSYQCGGGGKVLILYRAKLPMKGYPGGYMKCKITKGMGRDVFSATQAACDGLEFHLGRNRKTDALDAYTYNEEVNVKLREERKGGLIMLDLIVANGEASMDYEAGDEINLSKAMLSKLSPKLRSVITHNRLAHEGDERIRKLILNGHTGLFFERLHRNCAVCNMAAQTIGGPKGPPGPKNVKEEPKELPPEFTHYCMDLVDSTVKSVRGFKYMLTVVEMTHRLKYSVNLKKKSDTR